MLHTIVPSACYNTSELTTCIIPCAEAMDANVSLGCAWPKTSQVLPLR